MSGPYGDPPLDALYREIVRLARRAVGPPHVEDAAAVAGLEAGVLLGLAYPETAKRLLACLTPDERTAMGHIVARTLQ